MYRQKKQVTITECVVIRRPRVDIFAFVANYENDPFWRQGVVAMMQSGPTGLGTTTTETLRLFGRKNVTHGVVVSFRPDELVAFTSTAGLIPVSGVRMVEDAAGGTNFTYSLTAELSGLYAIFAPLIAASFRQRVKKDLRTLRHHLEKAARKLP